MSGQLIANSGQLWQNPAIRYALLATGWKFNESPEV